MGPLGRQGPDETAGSGEADRLRKLDKRGRLTFVDIAAEDSDGAAAGVPKDVLLTRLHARLADGKIVHSMEAVRQFYSAVGFGPVVALTRIPGISLLLDRLYSWYARRRVRKTNCCTLDAIADSSTANQR